MHPFIQNKVVAPALALLKQGLSTEKMTASVVGGTYCGLVPCPASSTIVTTLVGLVFRLNQPTIQFMNQLVGPMQIVLFLPFIRVGEWLFGARPLPLSMEQLMAMVKADAFGTVQTLWTTLWHAVIAWIVVAPVVCGVMYAIAKPVVARLLAHLPLAPVKS